MQLLAKFKKILYLAWSLELKAGEASSSFGSQVVNSVEITDGKLLFSAVINSEQGLKIYAFN